MFGLNVKDVNCILMNNPHASGKMREMETYLTVGQLREACSANPYILVRFYDGDLMGVNSKVTSIIDKRRKHEDDQPTQFIGFIPCNFKTYITHKYPYMSSWKSRNPTHQ